MARRNSHAFACRRVDCVSYEHLDLRAERHQPVERFPLRGSGEHGGDDAQGLARAAVRRELDLEQPQAVPAHESAEQVDGVGGRDLVGERVGEARLAARVDQEV